MEEILKENLTRSNDFGMNEWHLLICASGSKLAFRKAHTQLSVLAKETYSLDGMGTKPSGTRVLVYILPIHTYAEE